MNSTRFTALTTMILAAAATRLVPHPPNFTPIAAIALFSGAQFSDKRVALFVPLIAMFLSDLVLGLHGLVPVVYGCFALIVCLGFWLRSQRSVKRVAVAILAASVLFFIVTNFGVWAFTDMYPKTVDGLAACYIAAIPFFKNTLTGDLCYAAVLFGGLALAESCFPQLRPAAA